VICKLLFSLDLAETHRFGCGSTLDGACLWKSASAPVTSVSVKRINQQQLAMVVVMCEMMQRP
jgi:hypothetical protein